MPYESAILPLRWTPYPFMAESGVGEVFDRPQPFDRGLPVPGATGRGRICGTEEDFRDGGQYLPDLPPVPYTPEGLSECCADPPGGILMGAGGLRYGQGGVWAGGSIVTTPFGPTGAGYPVRPGVYYMSFLPTFIASGYWGFVESLTPAGNYLVRWSRSTLYISGTIGQWLWRRPDGVYVNGGNLAGPYGSFTVTVLAGWRLILRLDSGPYPIAVNFSMFPV